MTVSNRIFIWSQLDEWSKLIISWFKEAIPSGFFKEAVTDPRNFLYSEQYETIRQSTEKQLPQKFKETYTKIRLFHACRPKDVGSYLANGLVPLDIKATNAEVRALFLSGKFPKVSEEMLARAISELSNQLRGGHLYLSLDDVSLIKFASHYLIYGSEYLSGMAAYLSECTGEDCFSALSSIGIPTVFVCDIPLIYFTDSDIKFLVKELICYAIRNTENGEPNCIDYTFEFSTALPATCITSHYHPQKIVDSVKNRGVYINPQVSCPFCGTPE